MLAKPDNKLKFKKKKAALLKLLSNHFPQAQMLRGRREYVKDGYHSPVRPNTLKLHGNASVYFQKFMQTIPINLLRKQRRNTQILVFVLL